MKKILNILIIIIAIIGFIFGVTTIVKFIKLNNIYKKVDKYIAYDCFCLETKQETKNEKIETEAYYRKGIGKQVASNGIYTWTDGERAYIVDEANSTIYTLNIENNISLVSYNMFAAPIQGYNSDVIDRIFLAGDANTTIKKEKIDDDEYYCIRTKEKNAIKKVWVEKKSSKIKKATIEFSNGDILNYDYELTFNSVDSADVTLPDITGYKLINGETGTILTESFNENNSEKKQDETNIIENN